MGDVTVIEHRYRVDLRKLRSPFELYGAISHVLPDAHGAGWAIAPAGPGFVIRGPERAPKIERLFVGGSWQDAVLVQSVALASARHMHARCVVVRLTDGGPVTPRDFRRVVEEHVAARGRALGVRIELGGPTGVRVHGRFIRGFEAHAVAHSDAASLALMREGVGGKRSMGCGVFFAVGQPWR